MDGGNLNDIRALQAFVGLPPLLVHSIVCEGSWSYNLWTWIHYLPLWATDVAKLCLPNQIKAITGNEESDSLILVATLSLCNWVSQIGIAAMIVNAPHISTEPWLPIVLLYSYLAHMHYVGLHHRCVWYGVLTKAIPHEKLLWDERIKKVWFPGASHGDHVYSLKTYVVIETNGNRCLTE